MLLTLALSALWIAAPTPTPTPTPTPAGPVLSATIGKVGCPSRQAPVTVVNDTGTGASYTLRTNGIFVREEYVSPDSVIKGTVQLKEDRPTTITVTAAGRTIARAERTADCRRRAAQPAPEPTSAPSEPKLPHTGGGAETFAKAATGIAAVTTGGLLVFWGRLWPSSGRGDWNTPSRRTTL